MAGKHTAERAMAGTGGLGGEGPQIKESWELPGRICWPVPGAQDDETGFVILHPDWRGVGFVVLRSGTGEGIRLRLYLAFS